MKAGEEEVYNEVFVEAWDHQSHYRLAWDSWLVDVLHPGIKLFKWSEWYCAEEGEVVFYYIDVHNPSWDVSMDVEVCDPMLGGLLWAALIGGGLLVGVVKLFQRQGEFSLRWLLLGAVLALMGVLVHATMDFPLQVASIQLYVAVLLGLCWGAKAERPIYRTVRASAS